MAGTRGIARFRGEQLNNKLMRNNHFDSANKIDEKYLDIDFQAHRESLEDTKIDVFVQKNEVDVGAGVYSIEITSDILNPAIAVNSNTEGTVLDEILEMRKSGTQDFSFIDEDGDRVYAKVRENAGKFFLDFFSVVAGSEAPYIFVGKEKIDYKYITRTNLSVIPVDAIVSGGAGLVADAVDAQAYMNLIQLMKDLYAGGSLDNDGNANLAIPIVTQISNEIQARTDADQAIHNDLISTASGKGAHLVGVISNPNYSGITVQEVLIDLANKIKASNIADDARMVSIEAKNVEQDVQLGKIETENEEEVYEAVGGETEYLFVNGVAKDKTVLVFINGAAQAPGINFTYLKDGSSQVNGVSFAPDTLKVTNGVPDVLYLKYKKKQ